jgi:hypothetical protein
MFERNMIAGSAACEHFSVFRLSDFCFVLCGIRGCESFFGGGKLSIAALDGQLRTASISHILSHVNTCNDKLMQNAAKPFAGRDLRH